MKKNLSNKNNNEKEFVFLNLMTNMTFLSFTNMFRQIRLSSSV